MCAWHVHLLCLPARAAAGAVESRSGEWGMLRAMQRCMPRCRATACGTAAALEAFTGPGSISLGAGFSIAAGPVGRRGEAVASAGTLRPAAIHLPPHPPLPAPHLPILIGDMGVFCFNPFSDQSPKPA